MLEEERVFLGCRELEQYSHTRDVMDCAGIEAPRRFRMPENFFVYPLRRGAKRAGFCGCILN
jgi:hypothetical protein